MYLVLGCIKQINEFKEAEVVELEEGRFRLEFFKFKKPLKNDYSFSF